MAGEFAALHIFTEYRVCAYLVHADGVRCRAVDPVDPVWPKIRSTKLNQNVLKKPPQSLQGCYVEIQDRRFLKSADHFSY